MTRRQAAFTLVELLVVVAVLALLAALLIPAAASSLAAGRRAACTGHLGQLLAAYTLYLDDHDGQFFPWRENRSGGVLWYWGFETGGAGSRSIDRSQARLAPYLGVGTVETCPAFPYGSTQYKQKFDAKTYGYGINIFLLSDTPEARAAGVSSIAQVARPATTLAWGDAIQINTFQAPATPQRPLLEEWYYLAARNGERPTYHFRHQARLNAVALDGSVRTYKPDRLLPQCDGQVGYLEPRSDSALLTTSR